MAYFGHKLYEGKYTATPELRPPTSLGELVPSRPSGLANYNKAGSGPYYKHSLDLGPGEWSRLSPASEEMQSYARYSTFMKNYGLTRAFGGLAAGFAAELLVDNFSGITGWFTKPGQIGGPPPGYTSNTCGLGSNPPILAYRGGFLCGTLAIGAPYEPGVDSGIYPSLQNWVSQWERPGTNNFGWAAARWFPPTGQTADATLFQPVPAKTLLSSPVPGPFGNLNPFTSSPPPLGEEIEIGFQDAPLAASFAGAVASTAFRFPNGGPPTKTDEGYRDNPPETGVRERKFRLGKGGPIGDAFGAITEALDALDCAVKAAKAGLKAKGKKPAGHGRSRYHTKGVYNATKFVYNNFDVGDPHTIAEFIKCVALSNLSDLAIGKANSAAGKAFGKASGSPRGVGIKRAPNPFSF